MHLPPREVAEATQCPFGWRGERETLKARDVLLTSLRNPGERGIESAPPNEKGAGPSQGRGLFVCPRVGPPEDTIVEVGKKEAL